MGKVDDEESVRAIRRAIELGVTFFATADVYGTGHSERVLGKAVAGRREEVLIASKWGNTYDEATPTLTGTNTTPEYVRTALTASLERLGTDYLDLYQLHDGGAPPEVAEQLREACEELVREGLIRRTGGPRTTRSGRGCSRRERTARGCSTSSTCWRTPRRSSRCARS